MLSLAGALYFACLTQGPVGVDQLVPMASEHRESVDEHFFADLTAVVKLCGMLKKIVDHEFDGELEPTVEALLSSAHGETKVSPISSFKGP